MSERIKELLARPGLERLNDWVSIGPVQKAALEEFTELVALDCARVVTAQRREWQGLTDDEREKICRSDPYRPTEMLKLAEAKLREKNT